MDANNTRYHLIHGERDWLPVLINQDSNNIWWDREKKNISLSPIIEQLSELEQGELLSQEYRRGAAYDHYGNIYWINDGRNGIDYQPAATPLQRGQFWHTDNLTSSHQDYPAHGDFQTTDETELIVNPVLSGLAITTREYLVVGTLAPAGILIFDLHAGGPPEWLCWPQQIKFNPLDMSCSPGGGVWILSHDESSGEASVWYLDKDFRLLDNNGNELQLKLQLSNDFQSKDNSACEVLPQKPFYSGINLNSISPSLVNNPIAIEALSDDAFIILDTGESIPSSVSYYNKGELIDTVTLDDEAIGALLSHAEISGHDFAFLPDATTSSTTLSGLLYISALTATQSYEFILRATDSDLALVLQPKLLPMRKHNGRALIVSGQNAYYDFKGRWLPLTEQPRYRYQSDAVLAGIIKDGLEPDCVWHRIIMDACIPAGTKVIIESRAANTQQLLDEMPWQPEPVPYLRSEGSELPLHQPLMIKMNLYLIQVAGIYYYKMRLAVILKYV